MKTTLIASLSSKFSKLQRDECGNFGVVMAVSSAVLIGGIGAAVDYGGAASEKSRLQNITDSAVLAASASGETKKNDLKAVVDDVMAMHQNELKAFDYKMDIVDEMIEVNATAIHETAFMGMFGKKEIPISTVAGAPVPSDVPVHMSLVVDTTASMAGDNLDSLQDAAKDLIKLIEKGKDAGAKMAVVPFANYVNVGEANRNADWMDVPADTTKTYDCYMTKPVTGSNNCTTSTQTRYIDGVPEDYDVESCDYEYGDAEEVCPPPRDVTWRGCAGSRNAPLNITPAADSSSAIPGAMDMNCGSEILPLTDDFKDVADAIDDLTTNGNTYLPTGLIWGWRSLTTTAPLAAPASSEKTIRAMVFMTDGGNTMVQFDKDGTGDEIYHAVAAPDNDAANDKAKARMLAICDGIKNDGITLYTIGYKLPAGAAGDSAALESCASSEATAFSADSEKELKDAFGDIGKALATVRLAY